MKLSKTFQNFPKLSKTFHLPNDTPLLPALQRVRERRAEGHVPGLAMGSGGLAHGFVLSAHTTALSAALVNVNYGNPHPDQPHAEAAHPTLTVLGNIASHPPHLTWRASFLDLFKRQHLDI